MHEQSIYLLRRLKTELDADLNKYFGPLYPENESQLVFVGLYVVMVACESGKGAESFGIKEEDIQSRLLEKTRTIFDDFLREQGN